jgi:glycerophosphoryl diester phosphodiesterase
MMKRSLVACVLALVCGCGPNLATVAKAEEPIVFDLQGHRGARGLRPENTLAAFSHALELGVATLELDCGVTRDGMVVVSHDSMLNPDITRGADGKFLDGAGAPLVLLTYGQLQAYDVGRLRPGSEYAARFPEQQAVDAERIPRLTDLFALVERSGNRTVRLNIETKIDPLQPALTVEPKAMVEAIVAVIREAGMAGRITIQSFDWRTLALVRTLAPEIATVALTDQQPGYDTVEAGKPGASPWLGGIDVDDHGGSVPKAVVAIGSKVWSPDALDLTPGVIAEAHALGLAVIPWTVNDPKDMANALAAGVDGMITDRPDLLRALLVSKGIAVPPPTPAR